MESAYKCHASVLLYVIYSISNPQQTHESNIAFKQPVWTGLTSLGFGANLQHYNPIIDAPLSKEWNIPGEWKLISQLVFGSREGEPNQKAFKPVDERLKIYGKI